jgi:hypothetical protein
MGKNLLQKADIQIEGIRPWDIRYAITASSSALCYRVFWGWVKVI